MIIMLRDFKLGLIAMLPNLFIVTVVGFMGLTGIPMDLTALLIACIALGIAVDDTVHFLHHFQVPIKAQSCEAAVRAAAQHAGRAMVATSALLIVEFNIYCFGTNAAIFRFGLLTAFTVAAAVLTDLIVLPPCSDGCRNRPPEHQTNAPRLNVYPTGNPIKRLLYRRWWTAH